MAPIGLDHLRIARDLGIAALGELMHQNVVDNAGVLVEKRIVMRLSVLQLGDVIAGNRLQQRQRAELVLHVFQRQQELLAEGDRAAVLAQHTILNEVEIVEKADELHASGRLESDRA